MTGRYPTVAELKNAATAGQFSVAAAPLHPTGQVGEAPVSRIAISTTAYYNLVTSITEPGGTFHGASLIRVTPRT